MRGFRSIRLQELLSATRALVRTFSNLHRRLHRWRRRNNAAGAATFKYGTTRAWVEGMTVVLACGCVLELERGAVRADAGSGFELQCAHGARSFRPGTLRAAGCTEVLGGVLRGARHGSRSICSSAPKARSASSSKRRFACCRCARRWRSRWCRCDRSMTGSRSSVTFATGAADVAIARPERHRRRRDRASRSAVSRGAARGRRRSQARHHDSGRHRAAVARSDRAAARACRRPTPSNRSAREAWRPRGRHAARPVLPVLRAHGVFEDTEIALPDDARRVPADAGLPRERADRRQPPRRRSQAAATRASTRRRPT